MERVSETDSPHELRVRFEPGQRARLLTELRATVAAEADDLDVIRGRRQSDGDRRLQLEREKQLARIQQLLAEAEASAIDSAFVVQGPVWLWQAMLTGLTLDAADELEQAVRRLNAEGEARGSSETRQSVTEALRDLAMWVPLVVAIYEFPPAHRQRGEAA